MTDRDSILRAVRFHPAVWRSRFKGRWPFVVWLLAAGGAVFLYYHGGRFGGMSGTVEVVREEIAPLETARLQAVRVKPGQHVQAGAVLAVMDTTLVDMEMAVEKLQIDRQFADAVAGVERDLQDTRIRQAESEGELASLAIEVARLDELLANRLIDGEDVSRLRTRQEALKRSAGLYPEMIASLERDLAELRRFQSNVTARLGEDLPAVEAGVEASREKLGLLASRRDAFTLRAGQEGTISLIYHQPGNVIPAGEPILTLVADRARRVIGFLPESNVRDVQVGMRAFISQTSGRGPTVPARVVAMVPDIAPLPTRVNPFPAIELRGRRVILEPEAPIDLLPGEGIAIELERPWLAYILGRLRGAPEEE